MKNTINRLIESQPMPFKYPQGITYNNKSRQVEVSEFKVSEV